MSPILSKQVLEDIRDRNEISEVIGGYFPLQRNGATFKALCPFHKEKTPSFTVNPQRQIFHCFGCSAGGDVFKFIMQYEGLDFVGAVRLLAQRVGIQIQWETGADAARSAEKEILYNLNAEAADAYHRCLKESPRAEAARAYLAKRKLTPDIVEAFQIGYAPPAWDTLMNHFKKKKFDLEKAVEAGLLIKADKPNAPSSHFDRFRDRLMFPIRDEQGRVIAFSGRALVTDEKTAKYVNSPETPLFRKSAVLYALDRARHTMVDTRTAILCEGQIDVIRCHHHGFTSAIASQGTAFTEDHARILKRYADEILLVFDPDKAGQDAAIRTAGFFLQAGLAVRVATLPQGEDPDAFLIQHGAEAFKKILDAAESVVEFVAGVYAQRENLKTEMGLKHVQAAIFACINQAPQAVQRDRLLELAAHRLHVHPSDLRRDLSLLNAGVKRSPYPARSGAAGQPESNEARPPPPMEMDLIVHVAADPDLTPLIDHYLPLHMVTNDLCRRLIEALSISHKEKRSLWDIIEDHDDPQRNLNSFAAKVLSIPSKSTGNEAESSHLEAVRDLIMALWRQVHTHRRNELKTRLLSSNGSDESHHAIEKEMQELTLDLKKLQHWETAEPIIRS